MKRYALLLFITPFAISMDLASAVQGLEGSMHSYVITLKESDEQHVKHIKEQFKILPSLRNSSAEYRNVLGELLLSTSMHDELIDESWHLITAGANVNYSNTMKNTPLILAASRCASRTVKLLLDKKADVHARNLCSQATALYCLCLGILRKPENACEVAQLLIEKGSIFSNASLIYKQNPLHALLYSAGNFCPTHQQTCYWNNECIQEIVSHKKKLIELLVTKGCDLYEKDTHGKTPLDLCRSSELSQFAIEVHQKQQTSKS